MRHLKTTIHPGFRRAFASMFFWFVFVAGPPLASADLGRPVPDEGPTQVYVVLFVVDVNNIDSANQEFEANVFAHVRWTDSRLAHDGPTPVSRPWSDVWHPRIQVVNQQKLWPTFPEIVEIAPDGTVVYRQRVWGSFSQPQEVHDFPFDTQTFNIQLVSAGYTPDEVVLLPEPGSTSEMNSELSVPDWRILEWKVETGPFEVAPGARAVPGFGFSFKAKRQIGYFIVKVIIPLIFIVAMSWIVFWLDPKESGTRISVSITAMLTLIAYRFAVGTSLPKVSYLTRLDNFILLSTVLIFATLIEAVTTATFAKEEKLSRARVINRWSRFLFPAVFLLVATQFLIF
jgi:hypothetical protein